MLDNSFPQDVLDELADPEFKSMSHYSRSTYAKGCHGPLCRKAERDRGKKRIVERALAAGREPSAQKMTERRKGDIWRDALLDSIIKTVYPQRHGKVA